MYVRLSAYSFRKTPPNWTIFFVLFSLLSNKVGIKENNKNRCFQKKKNMTVKSPGQSVKYRNKLLFNKI